MLWIQFVLQNNCPKYNSNLSNDFIYFNCLLTIVQVSTRYRKLSNMYNTKQQNNSYNI